MNEVLQAEGAPPVDYPRLLNERCRGKKDLAAKLLRNLSEDSGPRWLIEAEAVVKKGDMAGIARIGHSIKGTCKMIYASTLISAGMALEAAGKDGSQAMAVDAFEKLTAAFSETSQWLRKNYQFLE